MTLRGSEQHDRAKTIWQVQQYRKKKSPDATILWYWVQTQYHTETTSPYVKFRTNIAIKNLLMYVNIWDLDYWNTTRKIVQYCKTPHSAPHKVLVVSCSSSHKKTIWLACSCWQCNNHWREKSDVNPSLIGNNMFQNN